MRFMRKLVKTRDSCRKEIIPFPPLFEQICRNFSMTKAESWDILFMLNDFGLIELVPGHGVKVMIEVR